MIFQSADDFLFLIAEFFFRLKDFRTSNWIEMMYFGFCVAQFPRTTRVIFWNVFLWFSFVVSSFIRSRFYCFIIQRIKNSYVLLCVVMNNTALILIFYFILFNNLNSIQMFCVLQPWKFKLQSHKHSIAWGRKSLRKMLMLILQVPDADCWLKLTPWGPFGWGFWFNVLKMINQLEY